MVYLVAGLLVGLPLAVRSVWSMPSVVDVILSGVTTVEQCRSNPAAWELT